MLFEKLGICLSGRRIARFLVCIRRGWNSHKPVQQISRTFSLSSHHRKTKSSRYLTNFFHEYGTILQFSFQFFFLSLFFHSVVIDTMIRNTGRLSIRFRIERWGAWDNLARDRESSCKISIKFTPWIDDSRDSSWKLDRRKARTTLVERMVDQETKRDRSWPFNVSVLSPVIYHRGSIAVSGSSQLRCFSSSWKYRYACVRSLRRDRKRDHRKSPRWNGSVISASISHSFLLKRRQI